MIQNNKIFKIESQAIHYINNQEVNQDLNLSKRVKIHDTPSNKKDVINTIIQIEKGNLLIRRAIKNLIIQNTNTHNNSTATMKAIIE